MHGQPGLDAASERNQSQAPMKRRENAVAEGYAECDPLEAYPEADRSAGDSLPRRKRKRNAPSERIAAAHAQQHAAATDPTALVQNNSIAVDMTGSETTARTAANAAHTANMTSTKDARVPASTHRRSRRHMHVATSPRSTPKKDLTATRLISPDLQVPSPIRSPTQTARLSYNSKVRPAATRSIPVQYNVFAPPSPTHPISALPQPQPAAALPLPPPPPPMVVPDQVVSDNGKRKWNIIGSLGKGGCGEVFLAQEIVNKSKGEFVALKLVRDKKQFVAELNTMKLLNSHKLGRGYTPKLIFACKKSRALIMDCYSESVATRFEKAHFKFSLKTVIMLMLNMMSLSREFYEKTGQVHVDLKPSNFCTSHDGRDLYLIDFGYSTPPYVRLPGQTGTPLFMAWTIQTLGATYPSWQDDLESLGYVIMFFLGGGKRGLPWGALRSHRDIALAKNDASIHGFCSSLLGTEYEPIAQPLATYLFVTRDRLRSFTMSDFNSLYHMLENVMTCCGFLNDSMYDWCMPPTESGTTAVMTTATTTVGTTTGLMFSSPTFGLHQQNQDQIPQMSSMKLPPLHTLDQHQRNMPDAINAASEPIMPHMQNHDPAHAAAPAVMSRPTAITTASRPLYDSSMLISPHTMLLPPQPSQRATTPIIMSAPAMATTGMGAPTAVTPTPTITTTITTTTTTTTATQAGVSPMSGQAASPSPEMQVFDPPENTATAAVATTPLSAMHPRLQQHVLHIQRQHSESQLGITYTLMHDGLPMTDVQTMHYVSAHSQPQHGDMSSLPQFHSPYQKQMMDLVHATDMQAHGFAHPSSTLIHLPMPHQQQHYQHQQIQNHNGSAVMPLSGGLNMSVTSHLHPTSTRAHNIVERHHAQPQPLQPQQSHISHRHFYHYSINPQHQTHQMQYDTPELDHNMLMRQQNTHTMSARSVAALIPRSTMPPTVMSPNPSPTMILANMSIAEPTSSPNASPGANTPTTTMNINSTTSTAAAAAAMVMMTMSNPFLHQQHMPGRSSPNTSMPVAQTVNNTSETKPLRI